jgi:hypothetical protein
LPWSTLGSTRPRAQIFGETAEFVAILLRQLGNLAC